MLVLTRKPGEEIVIDDDAVVITIISVKGNKARIGIKARDDVRIMRGELHAASQPSPDPMLSLDDRN
jgi:carbon storage regulator CsrA